MSNDGIDAVLKTNGIRWYTKFRKGPRSIHAALEKQVQHQESLICVAFCVNYKNVKMMKFTLFDDWLHFHSILMKVAPKHRTFFNVFLSRQRSLYIDIDHSCRYNAQLFNNQKNIGVEIVDTLLQTIKSMKQELNVSDNVLADLRPNCWLYTASRVDIESDKMKLSFHIMINTMIFDSCKEMKHNMSA